MKNMLPWLIAGLIVFVGVYTFIFPDSQLPVRVKIETVWEVEIPIGNILFEFDDFIVTKNKIFTNNNGEWKDIGFPEFQKRIELPAGLTWDDPVITWAAQNENELILTFPNSKQIIWDNSWSWQTNPEKRQDSDIPAKISENSSGEILSLGQSCELKFGDKTITIDTPTIQPRWNKSKIFIEDYSYRISSDGSRIERIRENTVTAVSDRTNIDPFLTPSKIITDGKQIFSLMKSSSTKEPSGWVQILKKDLTTIDSIIPPRNSIPDSISIWNKDTLLILWDDGVMVGYTLWGQEKFQFQIGDEKPLDMVSTDEIVFILTEENLKRVTLSARKSSVDVWPRILRLGNISELKEFSLFISTSSVPSIQIKGDGIVLSSIMGKRDGMLATFSINPSGLPAFTKVSGELLIETENGHEIVPYTFSPRGSIDEFRIFSEGLLNLETGEMLDYKISGEQLIIPSFTTSSQDYKVFHDYLSGTVFVLKPSPSKPLD